MSYLPPFELLTHTQKVCRLYRSALRVLWDNYPDRLEYRIQATLLRSRFDQHKNERNLIKAKQLVLAGQREVDANRHPIPRQWSDSYNAPACDQVCDPPDWVLDFWDPMEKAQYPYYFAKREQRKKEYIERWEKKYGKPNFEDYMSHH